MKDVMKLTRDLIHRYCEGKPDQWFSLLAPKCIFFAQGERMVRGSEKIQNYITKYLQTEKRKIYQEEYSKLPLSDNVSIVSAEILTGTRNKKKNCFIHFFFTFVYQLIGTETKIVYEHVSYEYSYQSAPISSCCSTPPQKNFFSLDLQTFQFVKRLLLDNLKSEQLCIVSGNQTLFIDLNTILYIQADGHCTKIYCIDKMISCTNKTLKELKTKLPDDFHQIHRSYIINIHYLTSIRCYEAELLSGICLPIPAASYGQIKTELEKKLSSALRTTATGTPKG